MCSRRKLRGPLLGLRIFACCAAIWTASASRTPVDSSGLQWTPVDSSGLQLVCSARDEGSVQYRQRRGLSIISRRFRSGLSGNARRTTPSAALTHLGTATKRQSAGTFLQSSKCSLADSCINDIIRHLNQSLGDYPTGGTWFEGQS